MDCGPPRKICGRKNYSKRTTRPIPSRKPKPSPGRWTSAATAGSPSRPCDRPRLATVTAIAPRRLERLARQSCRGTIGTRFGWQAVARPAECRSRAPPAAADRGRQSSPGGAALRSSRTKGLRNLPFGQSAPRWYLRDIHMTPWNIRQSTLTIDVFFAIVIETISLIT
jgi:hypothetical protein